MHFGLSSGKTKRSLISKANSTVLFAAGITAVVVSVSIVISRSLINQRAYQDKVITAKEKARDTLLANVNDSSKLEDAYNALDKNPTANSRAILDALPSKYDVPALGTSMEKITSEGGYKLEAFSGEDSADATQNSSDPKPGEIPFSVEISGTYDKVKQFTYDLQRSIRPFHILSLDVTSSQDNTLRAVYKLKTYYQPAKNLQFNTKVVK